MDLEIRNNQLVWVKYDGPVSEKPVSTMTLLNHCIIYGPGGGGE